MPPEVLVAGRPLDRLDDPGAVEGGQQHPLVAELDVVVGPLELLEPLLAEAQDELAAGARAGSAKRPRTAPTSSATSWAGEGPQGRVKASSAWSSTTTSGRPVVCSRSSQRWFRSDVLTSGSQDRPWSKVLSRPSKPPRRR